MGHIMNELVQLVTMMVDEVLAEDPIDFLYLPIEEDNAKALVINQMTEYFLDLKSRCINTTDFDVAVLAVMSKLALENFVLQTQLRTKDG